MSQNKSESVINQKVHQFTHKDKSLQIKFILPNCYEADKLIKGNNKQVIRNCEKQSPCREEDVTMT